jgi:hypothetical protein
MKVAIISMFGHYECLFFLCEILQEHKITLYISNHTKGEEHALCKAYSNIEVIKITENLTEDILSIYDEIIKLSSNDSVLHHPRLISLLHLSSLKDNSNRYISLSPFVEGENVSYMLPIYNPINVRRCYNKSITFVGYFLNRWVDEDLQYFIENSHHTFNFIVWGDGNYDNLTRFPNVALYCNVQHDHLTEIINNSSYILLRNASYINYDRFTGMISLGLSFKKPMILDKRTKETYNIPGIVYEKRYSELIDTLNNAISPIVYEKLIDSIGEFNKDVINKNKRIMCELCKHPYVL